jgi:hypothetical protein
MIGKAPRRAAPWLVAMWVVACLGCPRTVAVEGTTRIDVARVPRDTVIEFTLPRLADGQALLVDVLSLFDVEGGLAFGARAELAALVGTDPLRPSLFSLAALDADGSAVVAFRSQGGTYVRLPSRDPARTRTALALAIGGRSEHVLDDDGVPLHVVTGADGRVRALVRSESRALVLIGDPPDALAELALLARVHDAALYRPARAPVARAALSFHLTRGALTFVDEKVAFAERDAVLLEGDIRRTDSGILARARVPGARGVDDAPWRAGCSLVDRAVARARVPADLLASLLGDEERLVGPVEVLFLPHATERGDREQDVAPAIDDGELLSALYLVVVGTPRDDTAVLSLRESFGAGSGSPSSSIVEHSVGDGVVKRRIAAHIDVNTFVLSTGGRVDVEAIVEATPCARDNGIVVIDGPMARAALQPPPTPAISANGAFRRVMWRALLEVESVSARVERDPLAFTVLLDVRRTRGKPVAQ